MIDKDGYAWWQRTVYLSIIVEARKGWRGWMQRERTREMIRDDFQANLIPTLIFLPRAELEDTSR